MLPNRLQLSRREWCCLLPALATTANGAAEEPPLPTKVYPFESLPVRRNGENAARAIFRGAERTGLPIELHETELAAGSSPHPPHRHEHEEVFMMREGSLDLTIEGQTTRIGPGSAAYIASNQLHGVRNPGPGHAQYFVFALGAQGK